jgi:hypothetical protein
MKFGKKSQNWYLFQHYQLLLMVLNILLNISNLETLLVPLKLYFWMPKISQIKQEQPSLDMTKSIYVGHAITWLSLFLKLKPKILAVWNLHKKEEKLKFVQTNLLILVKEKWKKFWKKYMLIVKMLILETKLPNLLLVVQTKTTQLKPPP